MSLTFFKSGLIVISLLLMSACAEISDLNADVSCKKDTESYKKSNNLALTLTSQEWYLKQNSLSGVDVGVKIVGSLKGDSATIRTFGDGLIADWKISLDEEKKFNQTVGVFFTSSPLSESVITANTYIIVYSGKDTLKVDISSCPLQNIQYNSETQSAQ